MDFVFMGKLLSQTRFVARVHPHSVSKSFIFGLLKNTHIGLGFLYGVQSAVKPCVAVTKSQNFQVQLNNF